MRKYKYFLLGIIFRIFVLYIILDVFYFQKIFYHLPTNLFDLAIGLSVLIFDILFLTESVLYYLKMKENILLRVGKQKYYQLFMVNIIKTILLLIISQSMVCLISFGSIPFGIIFMYNVMLFIVYMIIFYMTPSQLENYNTLVIFVVMVIIKWFII